MTRRTAALLAIVAATAACKKPSRAERCAELRRQTIAAAEMIAKSLGSEITASEHDELRHDAQKIEQECLTWPPEVLECMEPGADPESAKCTKALAAMSGHVESALDDAPPGPKVEATATLGEVPVFRGYHVEVAPSGAIVSLEREAIVSLAADGSPRWRTPISRPEWLLVTGDLVLTGDTDGALIALDAATGAEAWRATPPVPAGGDDYDEHQIEAATRLGDHVVLALADGRFFRADPAACAKAPAAPACLRPMFTLRDETLDDPELIAFGTDLVLGETELIRRLSPTGEVRAAIFVRDSYGGIAAAGGDRLATVIDDELAVFDLAACAGPNAIELPRKPGRMYVRGEGDCPTCAMPPAGCLLGRPDLGDVDSGAPVVLRDGSIAVGVDAGLAHVKPDATKDWISEVPVVGPVVEIGEHLVALASDVGDDLDATAGYAVALEPATGKVAWRTRLDTVSVGFITSADDIVTHAAGPWIVLGHKGAIAWLRRP